MFNAEEHLRGHTYPHATFYYYKQWDHYEMPAAHTHEAVEIMYVLSGKCSIDVGDDTLFLKAGQFILIDTQVPHRLIVKGAGPCRMLNIEFLFKTGRSSVLSLKNLSEQHEMLRELIHMSDPYLLLQDLNEFSITLKRLVLELDKKQEQDLLINLMFSQLFIQLAEGVSHMDKQTPSQNMNDIYVSKAADYIHQHYDCSLTVQDIADYVHLNPAYLQRLFKAGTHSTLMQYLVSFRIRKAKSLLRYSDVPVTDISDYVGMNSRQHFSAVFKKETGMSPTAYRCKAEADIR